MRPVFVFSIVYGYRKCGKGVGVFQLFNSRSSRLFFIEYAEHCAAGACHDRAEGAFFEECVLYLF